MVYPEDGGGGGGGWPLLSSWLFESSSVSAGSLVSEEVSSSSVSEVSISSSLSVEASAVEGSMSVVAVVSVFDDVGVEGGVCFSDVVVNIESFSMLSGEVIDGR